MEIKREAPGSAGILAGVLASAKTFSPARRHFNLIDQYHEAR